MSNNDSFIDEVNEALQRDRLFAAFKKYGWIAIAGVLLIVGGAAYREWRITQSAHRAQDFGDAITAALVLPTGADQAKALGAITTEGSAEGAVLALMRAGTGDAAALKAVQNSEGIDPIYKDLATFKLLMLNPDGLDDAALKAGYEQLTQPGAPFRLLAKEQIAFLAMKAGDTAAAISGFQAIMEDSEVTDGLRQRAKDMITVLGGEMKTE